jgi:Xaa-Pro aminopeptidase
MASVLRTGDNAPLSVAERDRRYGLIRAAMAERGIGAIIVRGTPLLYLSGGIPGEQFGVLPAEADEPFTEMLEWRHLSDIPASVVLEAQDWITDLRSGRNPGPMVERLKELKLEEGTVGFAGPFPQQAYGFIKKALPSVELVDASDILNDVRTIKSGEELDLIDRANRVFNAAVEAVHAKGRPGMTGSDLMHIGVSAMWDAGGDLDSTFSINFDRVPAQNPVLASICLNKRIEEGDIATLTAHSHYQNYAGHSDQEIAFGDPDPRHLAMFEAVKKVRAAVLSVVRAGATQRDLVDAYTDACTQTGFQTSDHSQIHQYGLDVPEFPGMAYRIDDAKGGKGLGGAGNFTLTSGMVYSISPTVVDEATGDLLLGGTSLAVTNNGYRDLGARDVELLVTS